MKKNMEKDMENAKLFNKKWIKKQEERQKDFTSFGYGMGIIGILAVVGTAILVFLNL